MIRPLVLVLAFASFALADAPLRIETPMAPTAWALLERELLRANAGACAEFYEKYFDERGYLRCVERWGGDDGPDDAIENCTDWPVLHALGASDVVLRLYKQAWEGHLRQFTQARTTHVPFARDGMYYKEFPVTMDWLHNAEGLTVFHLQGLSDPNDALLRQRTTRYAGFYLNEDPQAPNYDAQRKLIRSLFNGSRGPLLRKATAVDWAGDPIEVEGRFLPRHGERSYEEMLAHFRDYNDIVGDHPQNLLATTLATNAFLLTGDPKYRRWVLEYVDAWRERMAANGDLIPTNIGLDGRIGGETGGRWYGGVYGWGFTVTVPQDGSQAHRNTHHLGFTGFMNAYLLTGDDRYLAAWRKQIDRVNANGKSIDGRLHYPRMFGPQGWYHFLPEKYDFSALEIYWLGMQPADRARLALDGPASRVQYRDNRQHAQDGAWLRYLQGQNADYPEAALRGDFARLRERIAGLRQDPTTPDTRLADDPLQHNPASVSSLVHLMLGGLPPGLHRGLLHCRLRYFDPLARRAGLPEDVAALIEQMTDDSVTVTLLNVSQTAPRTVIVQAGGYAEHEFVRLTVGGRSEPRAGSTLTCVLAPGCGQKLQLGMNRYSRTPTLRFPWDRE